MVKKPELDDDDAMFMPDLEENRRAPAFPFEDGAKRLEIRDPNTLGRKAWGYLSKDERFILSDSGRLWLMLTREEIGLLSELLSDDSSVLWLTAGRLRQLL
jgi:hypothetical protein